MENLNWGRASFNWHIPVIALTVAVNSQKAGNIAGWSKAGRKTIEAYLNERHQKHTLRKWCNRLEPDKSQSYR